MRLLIESILECFFVDPESCIIYHGFIKHNDVSTYKDVANDRIKQGLISSNTFL